jgi:hypothetical protein
MDVSGFGILAIGYPLAIILLLILSAEAEMLGYLIFAASSVYAVIRFARQYAAWHRFETGRPVQFSIAFLLWLTTICAAVLGTTIWVHRLVQR